MFTVKTYHLDVLKAMHVKNVEDFQGPLIFSGAIRVKVRNIKVTIS